MTKFREIVESIICNTLREKANTKTDAEKVYEDNKWVVIIPHTKEAAAEYSKGTQWWWINDANSPKNDFDMLYNKEYPLYIIINKQKPSERYELHFDQPMTCNDQDGIGYDRYILQKKPEFKKIFRSIVNFDKEDEANWMWFDSNELDYDTCLSYILENGYGLKYIPDELKDYSMCLRAVQNYGWELEYVPDELKDRKLCLTAIKDYGRAIDYVPDELITDDLCMKAIEQEPEALGRIPENFVNLEMCIKAVEEDDTCIAYVPKKFLKKVMQITKTEPLPSNVFRLS